MRPSREVAISTALQSWLLNNEPTPVGKRIAQELSRIDLDDRSIPRILTSSKLSPEVLALYHLISVLSYATEMALNDLAGVEHVDG